MDALKQISKRPFFKPGRKFCNDPSVVNAGNTKLTPNQRIFIVNFGKEREIKKFEGSPGERCQYEKCHIPLSDSNHYIYCRSCRRRYLEDLIERNPNQNPVEALEKLRRDRQPRKQISRKRA